MDRHAAGRAAMFALGLHHAERMHGGRGRPRRPRPRRHDGPDIWFIIYSMFWIAMYALRDGAVSFYGILASLYRALVRNKSASYRRRLQLYI